MSLNERQFSIGEQAFGSASEMWDAHLKERPDMIGPEGHMTVAEARSLADPNFGKQWDKFHTQEAKYIGGLAESVKARGVTNPIIIDESGMIYDGHHRVAAAEVAGRETIPWRHISRPDNPYGRRTWHGPKDPR